ncbi:DUF2057 family protein [Anaerobiospirillum sp. NML120449]|uniref:DUF2057 family protein n=1 Tax=Anaerobiospirillum sp. NML120449 TaxID=2932817 RepID=UPI001FF372B0|nr:DUF2057 family protein [Anaerobiospirillum sp. NML120449]MCK0526754.1 DUF2057 domain-containing protein [Anaerobiospirillum sp. NML120449]
MSKLGALLKVSALAGALALASGAYAASFKVPVNYSVELVDGQKSDFGYNRFSRTITLSPGRHQIVMLFEGTFGNARDSRLYQAANPIVVDIANIPDNAEYTFTYNMPRDNREAEAYTRSQKINLINASTKAALSPEEASYYILTSDSGFAILRDYREDLASVGRLYAPARVFAEMANDDRTGVTAENVPTVKAREGGSAAAIAAGAAAAAPTVQATSKKANTATVMNAEFDQLVQLYEAADDATKLKFVKYIMSH